MAAFKNGRKPWFFGLTYMALSIGLEILLLVVGRLQVPRDNRIIAPILLTVAPLAAAWWCGYRHRRELLPLAILTTVFTLILVVIFNRLTGIATGLIEPIIVRTLAGMAAAWLINRSVGNRVDTQQA